MILSYSFTGTMQRYAVVRIVGKGSFGKALLCRSKKDGKMCIIKQVKPRISAAQTCLHRQLKQSHAHERCR